MMHSSILRSYLCEDRTYSFYKASNLQASAGHQSSVLAIINFSLNGNKHCGAGVIQLDKQDQQHDFYFAILLVCDPGLHC